ncbi:aldehyde dehydrogenase (plasmid) [Rhodococcus opacus]|uniref:Aldehyde dehydrogenase n=1 Tax=Rhodococcus opacus TaxID=37919 RepID=A0A076F5N3_RHOOP|nr:aldehyde dehydrogenase [Rhodococcus opacus]
MDALRHRHFRMLIGGELVDAASGKRFPTTDPFTAESLTSVPDATVADVDAAVEAADRARESWRSTPVADRVRCVLALADAVEAHTEELALLDCLDVGSPITNARNDVRMALDQMRMFAGLALEMKGQTIPGAGALHLTVREPVGIVAKIFPFNHPLMFACRIAAPLIAGNTCVIKPPEAGPLSTLRLGELARDLFPSGVLNIVVGNGPGVPDRLVRHPAVRRIGFIGSENTGRAIQRAAAETGVKNVTLELGGKNAMVVFDDAPIKEAAESAVAGMNFMWAGQSCGSTSRLLVQDSVYDEALAEVKRHVDGIRVGDPLEQSTTQGTMVDTRAQSKALEYIRAGVNEGAQLVCGGSIPRIADGKGVFVAPTVLAGVAPNSRLAQEEIFGPVLSVLRFRDEQEALQIANGVRYGLTGSVWTNDLDRAFRVAGALEAGFTWINGSSAHFPNVPYGGVKASGAGAKEECLEELLSYTDEKVINVMVRK